MNRTAILNVVGLSERLLGEHTPNLFAFRAAGGLARIDPSFPAVTCTAQSNYLTGTPPARHGIVANGWYDRSLAEVQFWKQSNHLVSGEKLWETLRRRDPGFTCAKLFWWYNMYSTADYSITPRPQYPADGRKFFDIYTAPASIRYDIQRDLGPFPFPGFWGPAAGRKSPAGGPDSATRWIADAARWIERQHAPTLSLVYLPHLDYNLQRYGVLGADGALKTEILPDLRVIDTCVGELLAFFEERQVQVILLSEYGLTDVHEPVHLNRLFRQKGWLQVREERGLELLDAGASRVFAVADHQVAHVHVQDPDLIPSVRSALEELSGVDEVLGAREKLEHRVDHPRSGELIAIAKPEAWFTYYYWLDDARAPDFARCVDIHRKPGYDPVELFTDPRFSKLGIQARIAWKLLRKKFGFRMLMDVVPLDASLVHGSHGARPRNPLDWPVLMGTRGRRPPATMDAGNVHGWLLETISGGTN